MDKPIYKHLCVVPMSSVPQLGAEHHHPDKPLVVPSKKNSHASRGEFKMDSHH